MSSKLLSCRPGFWNFAKQKSTCLRMSQRVCHSHSEPVVGQGLAAAIHLDPFIIMHTSAPCNFNCIIQAQHTAAT